MHVADPFPETVFLRDGTPLKTGVRWNCDSGLIQEQRYRSQVPCFLNSSTTREACEPIVLRRGFRDENRRIPRAPEIDRRRQTGSAETRRRHSSFAWLRKSAPAPD